MQKDDTSLLNAGDILTAIALLTRLPVKAEFDRSAQAVWAYPLAGLFVAALAGVVVTVALWLGLAAPFAAGLWIAATMIMTGAMHEDGLADCADGFWGGWEPARRLEIMKDSQIGTYGVLALVLSVGLRWLAVWVLIENGTWFWALLTIEGLSRAAMPMLITQLPHARDTGLSHAQGRPALNSALLAIGLAAAIAFLMIGWVVFKLIILGGVAAVLMGWLAHRKIGGQTGDVLGATQQVTCLVMLVALA